MTWQAMVGVLFVLVGVIVKVLTAAGLLGAGEIGLVGEVSNLGMLLLGKELWPGSAESLAVKSRTKPPPIPGRSLTMLLGLAIPASYLLTGQLVACTATQTVTDARKAAEQMREQAKAEAAHARETLASARSMLDIADSAVGIACGFRRVEMCSPTEDTLAALRAGVKAADQAVGVAESTGIAMPTVMQQVETVAEQIEALGATVSALEEAVHDKAQEAARDGMGPVLQPTAAGPEGAAPAAP